MISFQANYITNGYIQKRISTNQYIEQEVAFVELDKASSKDQRSLKKVNKLWRKEYNSRLKDIPDTFQEGYLADCIYRDFKSNKSKNNPDKKFYALTTQKENFTTLDPCKILNITEVTNNEPGCYEIEYIQTKPKDSAFAREAEYQKIGTGMINCIKNVIPYRKIILGALFGVDNFYEKNGFKFDVETMQFYLDK